MAAADGQQSIKKKNEKHGRCDQHSAFLPPPPVQCLPPASTVGMQRPPGSLEVTKSRPRLPMAAGKPRTASRGTPRQRQWRHGLPSGLGTRTRPVDTRGGGQRWQRGSSIGDLPVGHGASSTMTGQQRWRPRPQGWRPRRRALSRSPLGRGRGRNVVPRDRHIEQGRPRHARHPCVSPPDGPRSCCCAAHPTQSCACSPFFHQTAAAVMARVAEYPPPPRRSRKGPPPPP